jgi:dienelactone hydrolase
MSSQAIGEPEQWEKWHGHLTVRNITAPTLTPFLPSPEKATGAAVVIAPGGAFVYLEIEKEGYDVARWMAAHGIAAFVLKYRTKPLGRDTEALLSAIAALKVAESGELDPPLSTPAEALQDAMDAMRLVRERATEWKVDPHRVGFLGFSAGAITTLSLASANGETARPDFIGSIYGPMTPKNVPRTAPPAFFAIALDDGFFASKGQSVDLVDSWRRAGVTVEARTFIQVADMASLRRINPLEVAYGFMSFAHGCRT